MHENFIIERNLIKKNETLSVVFIDTHSPNVRIIIFRLALVLLVITTFVVLVKLRRREKMPSMRY